MSKYVEHKHGMVVGSDNVFFICKGEKTNPGEFRDGYRAIVWAKDYRFDQVNIMSVFVQTPAQQILWMRTGGSAPYGYTLRRFWWDWLLKNVGTYREDWDVHIVSERADDCIFFKRRKDAIAFSREVDRILKGISLRDS